MTVRKLTELGEIMQLAFVPQDFEATIAHWVKKGAGPFHVLRNNKAEWQTCYGREAYPMLDVALGHWGDMQIEIIRQTSPEKTVYTDWFNDRRAGVHHTCIVVKDIDEVRAACAEISAPIVLDARVSGTQWFYADTGGGPGTLLEVIQYGEQARGLMHMIREAARDWDGSDPVREIG